MAVLAVRVLFIGFGVLLLIAAAFYYRWGSRPSRDEWEWRMQIQMYRGLVALIGIGLLCLVLGVLA